MKKVEGIYTYRCNNCESVFGIVARFGVIADRTERVCCPKCKSMANIYGEGHMKHVVYEEHAGEVIKDTINKDEADLYSKYPLVLHVEHISEILGISKIVVYRIMDRDDFPLIKINRRKVVNRDDFFEWLAKQSNPIVK